MVKFGGVALKSVSVMLRSVQFCAAAVVFGIFTFYLVTLHHHDLYIPAEVRAVEGISGAALVYIVAAALLVCCLGGFVVFGAMGMLLDLAFTGAFIYIAWVNRHATESCSGEVRTPYGNGNTQAGASIEGARGGFTRLPSLKTACRLQKAAFAVAIVGLLFFFLSIFVEYGLIRHRQKEKAFGPSPSNGYTAGSTRRKYWQRKGNAAAYADKNADALPTHATPADMRPSYATDATAVAGEPPVSKYGVETYGNAQPYVHGSQTSNGYPTPTGTMTGAGPQTEGFTRPHQTYNQNRGTF
ncbi:hypothetical protein PZA11_002918 [Diplocarpon coronariae]|uniref:MARVEL domain-containing protein n=1 Tax=Diplocarpon coronariae TaxID=2795749 RepID=A0A218Z1B8_9HELO|nr:hypothetical protein JHW43_001059 [Diplocarpon mali]OWP01847.1 hypothetical protein B2J93_4697 [Marssonina coronariae]